MSLIKNCTDCGKESPCEWCEVCSSFICEDCDADHDCLSDELAEEIALEEALLDDLDPDDDMEQ